MRPMRHTTQDNRPFTGLRRFFFILGCFFISASFVSCGETEVHAFGWFDERGSRLAFSSPETGSQAGQFSKQGENARYTLASPANLPEGYAVRLSFSASSGGIEFQVRCGDEKGKTSTMLCSIPTQGHFSFVVPCSTSNALRWIEVKTLKIPQQSGDGQGGAAVEAVTEQKPPISALSLQEIRFVPAMRGMRRTSESLEISPHFWFEMKGGRGYYEIRSPFEGLPPALMESMQLDVALDGDAGTATLFWGERKLVYHHTRQTSTFVVPASIFARMPANIRLEVDDALRVNNFSLIQGEPSTELACIDPGLLVYHAPLGESAYYLARWDLQPEVLIFLFKDYAMQDRYLKRLAFFVEKMGFVGRLAQDSEIADLHGWNAHDYRPEDLARFFDTATAQNFPLSAEERELEQILIKEGIIVQNGSRFSAGTGAIVSIAQESPAYLQYRFLAHELSHALFFTDNRYRDLVFSLYQKLTDDEKWFLIRYFRWMQYNVDSSYLMANEMQAYLMQQPLEDLEPYFSDTLGERLAQDHPELEDAIHEYMQLHLSALTTTAQQLGSYLEASYGFEPGRLYRVR